MERTHVLAAGELAALISDCLAGHVPEENINMYASENYKTGEVSFNIKICYPSMHILLPNRSEGRLSRGDQV